MLGIVLQKSNLKNPTRLMIIVTIFLTMALLLASQKTNAQGYNIEVSPAKVNIELKPGEEYKQIFRVGNYSGSKKTLYFYTEDFTVADDQGTPVFLENEDPNNQSFSLTKWITLPEESLELEDEEVKEVEVLINVPEGAEAGGHYAAFFTQTENPTELETSAIGSVGRIASLILTNVPGATEENLQLVDFFSNKKFYFEDNPTIEFTTTLRNEGNVHAIPTGVVFVKGGQNFKPKNIIYNEKQGAVLPNAPDRKITTEFTVAKTGLIPAFGKLDANLLVKYGSQNNEINSQIEFWLIPAKFTIMIMVSGLALLFVLWRTVVSFKK